MKNIELSELRETIGKKIISMEPSYEKKIHWHHLISEMKWMSNDFERERKDHRGSSRKMNRACKKQLDERKQLKVKKVKEAKIEVKKTANNISKLVQKFWRS